VDANYKVNLQILAKDMASSVVEGIAGKLGGLLKAGLALGALAVPVIAVGKALSECVKLAGEEEVGVTRLNAALKASFEGNAAAAEKAARGASAAHTVMVAAMKPDKLAAVGVEIQKVTARINDQSAALARSKKPTESAALALQLNQQTLAGLQAQFAAGSKLTAKSVGGVSAAVSKMPGTWEEASASIEKYLVSEAKRTALDDGEGRVAVQRLIEATGDYRKSLGLMGITQDLAAAKGMDLASAAQLVGRVAQGNTTILTRYGIQLAKGTTATEALAAMQKRFGGQAEAYGKTYEGSQKRLSVAIGNIKETIGAKLLPVLATAAGGMASWLIDALPVVEAGAEKFGKAIEPITDWVKILFENMNDNRGILYSIGSGLEYLATSLLGVKGAGFGTAFGDFFTKQLPEVAKQLPLFRGMFENMLLGTRVNWQPLANALEALGVSPELAAKAKGVATTITTYVQDAFDKVKLSYKEGGVGGVIEMMRLEALKAWPMLLGSFDTLKANLTEKLTAMWKGTPASIGMEGTEFIPGVEGLEAKLGTLVGKLKGMITEGLGLISPELATGFQTVVTWLEVNIPAGIEIASQYIKGTMIPAFDDLVTKIRVDVVPAMSEFGVALADYSAEKAAVTVANWQVLMDALGRLGEAFNTLKTAIGITPGDGVRGPWRDFLAEIGKAADDANPWTKFNKFLIDLAKAADDLAKALEWVAQAWQDMRNIPQDAADVLAGKQPAVRPPVVEPKFAEGGDFVTNRAMRILVGERGPERVTVTPLDSQRTPTAAPGVTLNMYNYDPDASELARRGTWKALAAMGVA